MLLFEIVESVDLQDFLVFGQRLHHRALQFCTAIVPGGYGIYADSHDDAMALIHCFRYAACQTVNLMGVHRVIDIHVHGTNKYVWAIIVQDDVKHTVNTFKCQRLLANFVYQLL